MRFPLNVEYELLRAVLEAIIPKEPQNAISRVELAQALGVNPAACKTYVWLALQSGLPAKQDGQGKYYIEMQK